MPTPKFRKERLSEIVAAAKKKKELDAWHLYGQMSVKHGISRRAFLEYLEALEEAGLISFDMAKGIIKYVAG